MPTTAAAERSQTRVEERRATVRYQCDPWVPVIFASEASTYLAAGHIVDVSEGGARIVAPATSQTPLRWADTLHLRVAYCETARRFGVEGARLRAEVVCISWTARSLVIHVRFAGPPPGWAPVAELLRHLRARSQRS